MTTFNEYLTSKKLSANTVHTYSKAIEKFTSWCEADGTDPEGFGYNDVLAFIQAMRDHGSTVKAVHGVLNVLRHYGRFLVADSKRTDNPAEGIFMQGVARKLPANLLDSEAMEALYKNYALQLHVDAGKKMMLGLLVFQGLRTEEIKRVQRKDLQLGEGKIFIRGTKRTNERWLSLQAVQIPVIQSHLQTIKAKAGPILQQENNGQKSEQNVVNQIAWIFKQLKQLNPSVTNAKQIRGSVITEWLRKYPLREVQYMAGHKYVSSTERYQVSGLEDLQQAINEHHPRK
jgi:integrase/recombinase XerD